MKSIALSFIVIASIHWAQGQSSLPCSDILSQAEEAYRKGKFDEIRSIAPCMGLYKSFLDSEQYYREMERTYSEHKQFRKSAYGISSHTDTTIYYKITPKRMKMLLWQLELRDSTHSDYLGNFMGFESDLRGGALIKNPRKLKKQELKKMNLSPDDEKVIYTASKKNSFNQITPFSKEERQRAYVLLGKTYQVLGVQPLSQFLSRRLIIEHPTYNLRDNENQSFRRIYDTELMQAKKYSAGVIVGWLYTIPVNKETNREADPDYNFQTVGSVLLGAHVNRYINENLSVGLNLWINNTEIEYREPKNPASEKLDFIHQENQSWMKFPVLVKWIPSKSERSNDILETRFYVQGGISFNYLVRTKATIADSENDLLLTEFDVRSGRNTFNSEILLGIGARFRFGRNYFTFSLNGAYGLRPALNQDKVASEKSKVFREFQVVENNYHTLTGFWSLTYEVRFNTLKRSEI